MAVSALCVASKNWPPVLALYRPPVATEINFRIFPSQSCQGSQRSLSSYSQNPCFPSVPAECPYHVVEIQVREQDETEYLLGTPANRERMERILTESAEGKHIAFETLYLVRLPRPALPG